VRLSIPSHGSVGATVDDVTLLTMVSFGILAVWRGLGDSVLALIERLIWSLDQSWD